MPNHTIAENLQRLVDAKTAIGNAITAKGGTVGANDGLEEFAADIATIPSGGGSSNGDIRFIDYDGTVVQSYSAADFANLSELPANPSHTGLTAQGWNWALADAKTYVAANGKLDIGQMYASNTTDGKTYLHIRLGEGRLKPYLGLTGNSSGTVVSIDWGDGSATESVTLDTSTIYTPHGYSSDGEYVITITVTNGTISLSSTSSSTDLFRKSSSASANNDKVYANILTKAELGTKVTSIGNSAFTGCSSLASVTIPSTVTSIGNYAFNYCYSLSSITIPSSVISIGINAFNSCYSLSSITIPSTVTSISTSTFQNCFSLTSVIISSTVTSIGQSAFSGCSALTSVTIPSSVASIGSSAFSGCSALTSVTIPSSITSISTSTFQNCSSLTSVIIPSTVTSIGSSTFLGCYSLASVTIPSTITSIGSSAFSDCSSLASVTIPSTVTSISTSTFQNCSALTSITIPSTVTSIGSSVFSGARGLGFIKFEPTSPPSAGSTNTWSNVPTDCIIYVPTGSLSAYTSANNYPSSSTYTYVEY